MPTLNIGGQRVRVDDGFLQLPPEQQNATVDEIAKSLAATPKQEKAAKQQPSITDAATDIPSEIGKAYTQGAQHLTGNSVNDLPGYDPRTRGQLGPIEGLMRTGKQLLGLPEIAAAIPVGIARSVGGHLMAQGEHGVGTIIAPEIAAKDDPQKMYDTAKGDIDTAMSASAPRRGIPAAPAPTITELETAYKATRNSPAVKEVTVPMEDAQAVVTRAEQDLLDRGSRPTPGSAPRTFSELERAKPKPPPEPTPQQKLQAEMNWEKLPEAPKVEDVTVDDLLAVRRALQKVAQERKPLPASGPTEDAAASSSTIGKLDDLIEEAAPGMREANANYSAAKTAEALDKRIQKAEIRASVNNSGMNIGNKIRQQAADILVNKAAQRGLKPEEIEMLGQVAFGTPTRNTLRRVSNYLGGGGGLGAVVTGEVASQSPLGALGWVTAPLGHVLKSVENQLTVKAARKVSEAVRSRSPLGQAIQSSAKKWNEARDSYLKVSSPAKAAALSIATRNLASTISGAGVKIDPGAILRQFQGPKAASANDEQQ